MELKAEEKKSYIEAISQEIFHKLLSELKWENLNTISCNLIVRKRNGEIDEDTYNQIHKHLLSMHDSFPRNKTNYDWED